MLGLALILAMLLQVRLGLRHWSGCATRSRPSGPDAASAYPRRQPLEVRPLVVEINALLDQNAANLERARRHVANLAHGLKTPLRRWRSHCLDGRRQSGELRALVDLMERRIRHHLGRARAPRLSGPVRGAHPIAPRIGRSRRRCCQGPCRARQIALTIDFPPDLAVACEPQDFDEMAGNLLENAFKWARGASPCAPAHKTGRLLPRHRR